MSAERFRERQSDVARASRQLMEIVGEPASSTVRDATIKRFEFTFEATWKAMKLYLNHAGLAANSPRDTIKQAFVQGLLESEDEARLWLAMLEDRNLTTHTYREALAQRIYDEIQDVYAEQLATMAKRIEGLVWS